ncbi:MAG: hypothetical protein ACRYGA_13110 [Janthinobacterium lividum]
MLADLRRRDEHELVRGRHADDAWRHGRGGSQSRRKPVRGDTGGCAMRVELTLAIVFDLEHFESKPEPSATGFGGSGA